MSTTAPAHRIECLRCRFRLDDPRPFTGCPRCRAEGVAVNMSVVLDHAALAAHGAGAFPAHPRGLWRFRVLLPVRGDAPVSLGEGDTPLIHLERLGHRLGLDRLYAKDESQNPTWSYKDRLCSVAVTHAVESGARVITIASTGNHGAATAAYAARAGLPCVIFTLASVPETMKTLMQAYGAAVLACATSEQRWRLMRTGIERLGWYPTGGFVMPPVGSNPFGIEGYKTIAYEVVEALDGHAPDVVVVPSAYSDGLYGIWKGMTELRTLGRIPREPRMVAAEPLGPLANALEKGLEVPERVKEQSSVAFSIASPFGTMQGLRALRDSGGHAVRITDEGIFEAQRALAREGIFAEPSSSGTLTAVMQLRAARAIGPHDVVVIVVTSSGLKDFRASQVWLPPVPDAGEDFDEVIDTIREHYGLALDR